MPKIWNNFIVVTLFLLILESANTEVVKNVSKGKYEVKTSIPTFSKPTPLAKFARQTSMAWALKEHKMFIKEAEKDFPGNKKPSHPYEHDMTYRTSFYSPNLISLYFDQYENRGGPHPNSYYHAMTFGIKNGKPQQLKLKDLFIPNSEYKREVSEAVIAKLRKNPRAIQVQEGEVNELTDEQLERFVVTKSGLTFLINTYEVGPHAVGRFEVKLTFAELGEDFRREWVK